MSHSINFNNGVQKELPMVKLCSCKLNNEYTISKMMVQPGWSWSKCIKPIVGTNSCMAKHVGVLQSGRIGVKMDNGHQFEVGPGEAYVIEPGHDGWVIGDEEVIGYEFNAETAGNFGENKKK